MSNFNPNPPSSLAKKPRVMGRSVYIDDIAGVDPENDSDDEEIVQEDLNEFFQENFEDDDGESVASSYWPEGHTTAAEEDREQAILIQKRLRQRCTTSGDLLFATDLCSITDEVVRRLLTAVTSRDKKIFSVRVVVGRESVATEDILSRLNSGLIDDSTVELVVWRPSLPGFLFLVASSSSAASSACRGIPFILRHNPRLVPYDEIPLIGSPVPKNFQKFSFVRIATKGLWWGDLAFIISIEDADKISVILVPRIPIPATASSQARGKRRRTHRPPQRLFDVEEVRVQYGRGAVKSEADHFVFRKTSYLHGLVALCASHTQLQMSDIRLTWAELEPFLTALPIREKERLWKASLRTFRDDKVAHLKVGYRVNIVEGSYVNMVGEIIEIADTRAMCAIKLPVGVVEVSPYSIDLHFSVGDHIIIRDGPSAKRSGMVLHVVEDRLVFLETTTSNQIVALAVLADFYNPDFSLTSATPSIPTPQQREPVNVFVGKHVIVSNGHGLKGYWGIVRSVHDTHAVVVLDANQRRENIPLNCLYLKGTFDTLQPLPSLQELLEPSKHLIETIKSAIMTAAEAYHPPDSSSSSLTPMQTPSTTAGLSGTVWDASLSTPDHWSSGSRHPTSLDIWEQAQERIHQSTIPSTSSDAPHYDPANTELDAQFTETWIMDPEIIQIFKTISFRLCIKKFNWMEGKYNGQEATTVIQDQRDMLTQKNRLTVDIQPGGPCLDVPVQYLERIDRSLFNSQVMAVSGPSKLERGKVTRRPLAGSDQWTVKFGKGVNDWFSAPKEELCSLK